MELDDAIVARAEAGLRGPSEPMPLDVRRPDVSSLPPEVVAELCEWCGVDRAGGCGACSDLRVVKR